MEDIGRTTRLLGWTVPEHESLFAARPAVLSPISFGRVNDGRPITSRALLFRLPIELVQEVVGYLDTADLQSLALVDRDCRQLARSRLFISVVLDYCDREQGLLGMLSLEARSRRENGGVTESPSIGACIRRVTVAARAIQVRNRHSTLSTTYEGISDGEERALHDIACNYCERYLPNILEALRFSLPNLDELIWMDKIEIPPSVLTAIASLPIRHLGLRGIQLSLACGYQLPLPEQQRWALRSLDLGTVLYPRTERRNRVVSEFCLAILEAAAPTLERLSWRDYQGTELSFGNSAIRFPKLRTLLLDTLHTPKDAVLDAFFPPDVENRVLRSVSVRISSPHARKFFDQRGHIRGLESLRLDALYCPSYDKATDSVFLSANPQLKCLTLSMRIPGQLTNTLLSLLPSEFKFLTTLVVSFTFSGGDAPSKSLAAISRFTTLTSLWIAVSRRSYWTDDVPATIATLSPLRNLTRLALSRSRTFVAVPVRKTRARSREKMRSVVELYVKEFRELRCVYLGGCLHRVVGNAVVTEGRTFMYYSHEKVWETADSRL